MAIISNSVPEGFLWMLESPWFTYMADDKCQGVNIIHFHLEEQPRSEKVATNPSFLALGQDESMVCCILYPRIIQSDCAPFGHSGNKITFSIFLLFLISHPPSPTEVYQHHLPNKQIFPISKFLILPSDSTKTNLRHYCFLFHFILIASESNYFFLAF